MLCGVVTVKVEYLIGVCLFTVDLCVIVPSLVLVSKTSRKAIWLCSSSFANIIFSVVLFIECKMSSVLPFLTVARTSSTYRFHVLKSLLPVTDLFSRSCMTTSARKLGRGDPIGAPAICRQ